MEQEICDIFTTSTGEEDYDDVLNQDPGRFLRSMKGEVIQIKPEAYIAQCAKIKGTSIKEQYSDLDESKIQKFARAMDNGEKFNLPFINYNTGHQDGRHRVMAAKLHGCNFVNIAVFTK